MLQAGRSKWAQRCEVTVKAGSRIVCDWFEKEYADAHVIADKTSEAKRACKAAQRACNRAVEKAKKPKKT